MVFNRSVTDRKNYFMLNIDFYLREPQAKGLPPIIMRLILQGEYKMAVTAYRDHQNILEGRPPTL
jgi:hypothetical protein